MKSKLFSIGLILFCYFLIAHQSPAQVLYPYPISGYFAYDPGYNNWPGALQRIQRLGGTKIIQFGRQPERKSETEIKQDYDFKYFKISGTHCIDYIRYQLKSYNQNNNIRYLYTFKSRENFSYSLYGSWLDKRVEITIGSKTYAFWCLVFSASNPNQYPNFYSGGNYDLILIAGDVKDSVTELLQTATQMGMEVYLGMPKALPNPTHPWEVWQEPKPLFLAFSKRIFLDYKSRHGNQSSFAGLYQSFETPVQDSPQYPPIPSVLSLYKEQHNLVRATLPAKKILVSPYWDARKKDPNGQQSYSIKGGFKKIAQTNVDIIAPQDGRGTGKVGLFWPYQSSEIVPSELWPIVGYTTYGQAYYADTREFYRVCREAVDELASQGISVNLWANVEAFEPSGSGPACQYPDPIWRTNKNRLDHALTFDGTYVSDQISFRWDLFYFKGDQSQTIEEQIQTDWKRPILVEAFRWYSNYQNGVIIRGYNIVTGKIRFTYYDRYWQIKEKVVPVSSGWVNPNFGSDYNQRYGVKRYHDRLQEVWIPFAWTNMAPNFWLHIESFNSEGMLCNHRFSLQYWGGGLAKEQDETDLSTEVANLPTSFELGQNYPNPFNPSTTINFSLPVAGHVKISVFDVLGRKVTDLVDAEMPAGYHQVEFTHQNVPAGVYFYTMESGNCKEVRKMNILK